MEFPLREAIGADDELAHHTTPQLREFRVPKMENAAPQDDCRWNRPWGAKWVVSDPQQSAGFSAIAYYFGRQLVDHLHSPVGIINASYAGTPIEACISQEALDKDAELKEGSAKGRSDFVLPGNLHSGDNGLDRSNRPPRSADFRSRTVPRG
jgi:sialate O-acetylesterase